MSGQGQHSHAAGGLILVMLQGAHGVLQHWSSQGADITAPDAASTAVLAALSFWDYSLVAEVPGSEAYKATGRCFSVASGRISFSYALKGERCTAGHSQHSSGRWMTVA